MLPSKFKVSSWLHGNTACSDVLQSEYLYLNVTTIYDSSRPSFLLLPAGLYFVSHSYSRAGETQYVTVVALEDNTQVLIQKPDEEVFAVGGAGNADPQSNVITFNLNVLDSARYVLVSSVCTACMRIDMYMYM